MAGIPLTPAKVQPPVRECGDVPSCRVRNITATTVTRSTAGTAASAVTDHGGDHPCGWRDYTCRVRSLPPIAKQTFARPLAGIA